MPTKYRPPYIKVEDVPMWIPWDVLDGCELEITRSQLIITMESRIQYLLV